MMKQRIKFFFHFLLIALMLCCFIWHQLIIYGISQGIGQLSMIWKAKPISEILEDETFSDSLKTKLRLIVDVKRYTIDSLGFKPSRNYTTFYDQHQKPLLYTITACEPYSFKPKEWTFPLLGAVSYKGFFNKEKAKKEFHKLKEEGYDVDIYSPSGWSTLGWFKDPIQSNMLEKSDGSLINLIIHELSHGTLYIKNNVNFNENLANFIGDKGAELFLNYKFGPHSTAYQDYEQHKKDDMIFADYMLKSTERLDSLYHTFSDEPDTFKKAKKTQLITSIVLGVNRLPLSKHNSYFRYALKAFHEGNAFFMAFTRYDSQYELFEQEYTEKFGSNLRKYLDFLKKTYPSL